MSCSARPRIPTPKACSARCRGSAAAHPLGRTRLEGDSRAWSRRFRISPHRLPVRAALPANATDMPQKRWCRRRIFWRTAANQCLRVSPCLIRRRIARTTISALEVEDLTVHFPLGGGLFGRRRATAAHAVDGVSISSYRARASALGLVGESGSGKSTTVALVRSCGLMAPTRGRIVLRRAGDHGLAIPAIARRWRRHRADHLSGPVRLAQSAP